MNLSSEWFTTRDGSRIHYLSTGNLTDNIKKPCAIIIHGWSSSSLPFIDLGKELSRNGFKVAILDLKGHGQSFIDDFSAIEKKGFIRESLDNLHEFIITFNLDNIILIGYSLGGAIIQLYVAAYPKKIRKIALLSSSWRFYLPWYLRIILILPTPLVAYLKRRIPLIQRLNKQLNDPRSIYRLLSEGYKTTDTHIMKLSLHQLRILNTKNAATHISKNVLLFAGSEDPLIRVNDLKNFPLPSPQKKMIIIPGQSHLAFFQTKYKGIRCIISFITAKE